jgi:YVTN family beta-propeller protein
MMLAHALLLLLPGALAAQIFLPTGKTVTPDAAPGAVIQTLNPGLPKLPGLNVGQAVSTSISPDGNTLLVLTSGYNKFTGAGPVSLLNEYVFVYDISKGLPRQTQVVQVANTFSGICWNPNGGEFYVAGGMNDNVRVYAQQAGAWVSTAAISLRHQAGLGVAVGPIAAGIAVNAKGDRLVAANFENDSVTIVDLRARTVVGEVDLRPGVADPTRLGTPGGEYPFWVAIKGDGKAYVSSIRDREIVVVDIARGAVAGRIPVPGQPNKMTLNKAQTLLYAALDNADAVAAIDTVADQVVETFETIAPQYAYSGSRRLRGANPNSVTLSPDEKTLYVTNGGSNSVAVVQLRQDAPGTSQVIGLIPTGWYPNSVSVSKDGSTLYVVNGKSVAGPDPLTAQSANQYVLQLMQAGLLTLPVPAAGDLADLTRQVAANNGFPGQADFSQSEQTMAALRARIQHVIYIVKENRTYDQILGDLEVGNGDPALAMFPWPITPNQHRFARLFVTLDNFYDTGEVSGNGWNWSTAARATDVVEKTVPVNYAGRGLSYDWEGSNRNINPALATVRDRRLENPQYPNDPNLMAGSADVSAPDGPGDESGAGYLWDGAARAGLSVRNYGFFANRPAPSPISARPYADRIVQASPTKQALANCTDLYYRPFDMDNADFYLFREWEREFDIYTERRNLPNLMLVRMPHDHTGNFGTALWGVNTPETQTADNDFAVGLVAQKVAASPFAGNTLIFIVEDDAQSGPDHMEAHRSTAYVIGPYVKRGAVVSKAYTTVSLLRTIKDVLGIDSMNFYDGLTEPMADVFDMATKDWSYRAIVPEVLRTTTLPLPRRTRWNSLPVTTSVRAHAKPRHSANWWKEKLGDQNFEQEDRLETDEYNRVLWEGVMGSQPYPLVRDGRDLREGRGLR